MKVLTAITGASGFPLAVRFLKELENNNIERHLVISRNAKKVQQYEGFQTDILAEHVYDEKDTHASICSGSFPVTAMVVIPCSMNTLAHIANGLEHNAITRAAAVNLKEERSVVLVPRDTPLSLPALKNMVKAKEAGCSIVPPMLCYYNRPETVSDCTDFVVGRVLDVLDIEHKLYRRWEM